MRDGREVWIHGERVKDVTRHPRFARSSTRARIYDMAHEDRYQNVMSYVAEGGERCAIGLKPPRTRQDWLDKHAAVDAVMNEIGGVVTRVGDETAGEMWSLYDGQDVLNEVDPRFAENIRRHVDLVVQNDPFHVSANTDPGGRPLQAPARSGPRHAAARGQGDRRRHHRARGQVRDRRVLRQPGVRQADDRELGRREVLRVRARLHRPMDAPGLKHICRTGFAGSSPSGTTRSPTASTRSTRFVFDDVLIPWENVLFYQHTRAASFIRGTLHRYSAMAFVLRIQYIADMLIGAALFNVRQTGLDKQQAVREKLAVLACYREGINAHLTAAIALAEESPSGLLMPNQSLLYAGRVHACTKLPEMMHLARELCRARSASRRMPRPSPTRIPSRGSTSSTRSTRAGWPRTGASCWRSRATF